MVMGRLGAADRVQVESYFSQGGDLPAQRLRRAQMHLVSKGVDPGRPQGFVRSLGNLLLAKSVLPRDQPELRVLTLKMSRSEAQELRHLIDESLVKNSDASVIPYREDLLTALRTVVLR